MRHGEDDEADLEEGDFPELGTDDDATDTVPCPYCGASLYEDAVRCSRCGNYFSAEDAPRHRPWWFIVGLALSLAVALTWAFLG